MAEVVPLKRRKGTAREQLLAMAEHQARIRGESLADYLRHLQREIVRDETVQKLSVVARQVALH